MAFKKTSLLLLPEFTHSNVFDFYEQRVVPLNPVETNVGGAQSVARRDARESEGDRSIATMSQS